MTTFKRWYLLLGFGVVLAAVGPRGVQIVWTLAAFGFLTLVVLSIRASRRRSYREFVEKPNRVLATLKHDTSHAHDFDGWY